MQQIETLLLSSPGGLTRAELSRRLQVSKSSITRDIQVLSLQTALSEEDDGRLFLDKRAYLSSVRLTLFEMEALYLSAKLFARVMRFPFPHAPSALRKLAEAQSAHSPILSAQLRSTAEDIDTMAAHFSGEEPRYRRNVEQLGLAISDYNPVRLFYRSPNAGGEKQYTVFPLSLEPHFEGRSIYLVSSLLEAAPASGSGGLTIAGFRTFNLEHIRNLDLLPSDIELAKKLPLQDLRKRLNQAWSIWTSDSPQRVQLRFSAAVAPRVRETIWHPSQSLLDLPDGRLLWNGVIAEPQEMYPWIRGWGPAVEVLEPATLRSKHIQDLKDSLRVYNEGGLE